MLLNRMTREDENATTELLANLMDLKYVRDAIIKYLLAQQNGDVFALQKKIDGIQKGDIKTQFSTTDSGQPDLIIDSEELFIVIENKVKVDTELQPHELNDYVRFAGRYKNKKGYLIFLIPKNYVYINFIQKITGNDGVRVNICYWEDLLSYLNSLEFDSPVFGEAIKYLRKFFPIRKDLSLEPKEVVAMFKLNNFFEYMSFQNKIQERLQDVKTEVLKELNRNRKEDNDMFKTVSSQCNQFAVGEYIVINKKGYIFFGISHPKDFADPKYCFSVCFWSEFFNCEYLTSYPFVRDEKWGWYCVPFFDESYSEEDFIDSSNDNILVERIVSIISKVCESMKLL